jgi:type I restriction enzyme S subunit
MAVKPGYKRTEVGVVPDDWAIQQLGELGSFKNGINKGKEDFGHGFPFVNLIDVFGVPKVSAETDFGRVNTTVAERSGFDLRAGDVLFVRSSVKPEGVGLTALIPTDLPSTVFSGFLIRYRDKGQLTHEFMEHCFWQARFRRQLVSSSTVSANTNINQDALKRLQVAFPHDKKEQRAIAAALSDTDALLTKLDQLITKKRDLKQAAMQQLLTGKTRLPGFSGEWEVKPLGVLGACMRGVTYKGDSDLSPYDTLNRPGF